MFCRHCGAQNDDNAYKCVRCGQVIQESATPAGLLPVPSQQIQSYLVQSILVTLFCCLPLGIAAIVFAAQVNGKVQAGDIQGALEASRKAKALSWWSFGVGLVGGMIYFLLVVASESGSF